MKIMTILGTRPEIIRLSIILKKLDQLCRQVIVHTGQNYDYNLNGIFMKQLEVREPDYYLDARGTFGEQIGKILSACEEIMVKEKPDKFLVLGDTNSSLAAIMAKRLSIPVYHMEAGNRCYDDRVPEEVNRRLIDHCSDILLPYTERSRQNLLREGIPNRRIYVTGNPIKEVLDFFQSPIDSSNILETLKIKEKKYFLVTLHRAENVDIEARLQKYLQAFADLWRKYQYPVICSLHPRTKARLKIFGKSMKSDGVIPLDPLGLFEFVHLEKNALCVLSDSGTVQEECCIFKIPSITLRDVTERPETLEVGSNILSGADPAAILNCMATVLSRDPHWTPPPEYMAENVSDIVIRILGGFLYQNPLRDG